MPTLTPEQVDTLISEIVAAIPGATLTRSPIYLHDNPVASGFDLGGEKSVRLEYLFRNHRIVVTGGWPSSQIPGNRTEWFGPNRLHPQRPSTTITISADKSPQQIAAEILRRFLPEYLETLALCLERRDAHDRFLGGREALANKVAEVLNKPRSEYGEGLSFYVPENVGGYGDISVTSSDAMDFRLRSVPRAKALRLLEFLKTL